MTEDLTARVELMNEAGERRYIYVTAPASDGDAIDWNNLAEEEADREWPGEDWAANDWTAA